MVSTKEVIVAATRAYSANLRLRSVKLEPEAYDALADEMRGGCMALPYMEQTWVMRRPFKVFGVLAYSKVEGLRLC